MTDEEVVRSFLNGIPVCGNCRIPMEQDYMTDHFLCPNCDFEIEDLDAYMDDNPYSDLIDEIHFVNYDEDDIPAGCSICGNPAWPNCQTSCNLFDD